MMMWKLLIKLICALNEITSGNYVSKRGKSLKIPESNIRAKRVELEKQYHTNYLTNEVIYRNWPEVHENPKKYCLNFLEQIFPNKKDLALVSFEIQKVILAYNQIRDHNNNIITPQRVTALKCRSAMLLWHRKFVHFIRSPQSPECVLFLNRIGKRTLNFYIVENICKGVDYPFIRKFKVELQEDKVEGVINRSNRRKRRMFVLPDEEIKAKHNELEQRHYEYCSQNPEICKLWPEVQVTHDYDCQRFLRRMLPQNRDLSPVVGNIQLATLHYLEISDEHNGIQNQVAVNTIACVLPQTVRKIRHVHFIKAPSYPHCVFYVIQKMLLSKHFYIIEEICDTPNHETSLYRILLENEQSNKLTRTIELFEYEMSQKIPEYENLHFQEYFKNRTAYEEWPELKEINIKSYCQTIIENTFPHIEDIYDVEKLVAELKSIKLKYATLSRISNEKVPLRKIRALECLFLKKTPPNQFLFIRTSKPECVYWIRRRYGRQIFYFIARQICKVVA